MKKEFKWEVMLGGMTHNILCIMSDNGYDLYDGDDHITKVYRKSVFHNFRGGVEKDIRIDGHTVRFVAWDKYMPDIAVNGMLVGEGVPYKEARATRNKARRIGAVICLVICAVLFIGVVPMIFIDKSDSLTYAIDSVIFLAAGIFCALQIHKYR